MLRRIAPAVVTAAVLAGTLTACSQVDTVTVDRGDCTGMLGSGALSDNVVALGGYGSEPQISIPTESPASVTQRTIIDSSGVSKNQKLATEGTIVSVNFAFFDQGTGDELFRTNGFAGAEESREFFMISEASPNPLSESLRCAAAGERVVLAMSPDDAAPLRQQLGGNADSSMIAILDVEAVSETRTDGRVKGLPNGFPAVVTDANGQPGVVLPPREARVGSHSAVRIEGDGAEVTAEQSIIAQVFVVNWKGEVEQNTWQNGGPQQILDEETAEGNGINFRGELTGAKVGSQVVITQGGDSARVIVVDILAAG